MSSRHWRGRDRLGRGLGTEDIEVDDCIQPGCVGCRSGCGVGAGNVEVHCRGRRGRFAGDVEIEFGDARASRIRGGLFAGSGQYFRDHGAGPDHTGNVVFVVS